MLKHIVWSKIKLRNFTVFSIYEVIHLTAEDGTIGCLSYHSSVVWQYANLLTCHCILSVVRVLSPFSTLTLVAIHFKYIQVDLGSHILFLLA